jgi:hypothetical protein
MGAQKFGGMMVTNIMICKLPYQDHFFVHGVRDGKDVWLTKDGGWSEIDGDPNCNLEANSYLQGALMALDRLSR